MTVVTFLRDFQGLSSNWQYYLAGTTVDLPDHVAAACLAEGVVSVVPVAEVPPVETPVEVPPPTSTGATARKPATKRAAKKAAK